MNPLPRTGSYLIDSMLFVAGAIAFTFAVGVVVVGGALLIEATLHVTQPYTGSRRVSSLLALLVFAAYVGLPTYLIATRTDRPEDDRAGVEHAPGPGASAGGTGTDAGAGEGPSGEGTAPERARCDGAPMDDDRRDRTDGERL